MNNKNKDMLKLSSLQFSLWEMHIYLDTHPDDTEIIEKYKKYLKQYEVMLKEYEAEYGPITQSATGVEWLKNPWPWEISGESDD